MIICRILHIKVLIIIWMQAIIMGTTVHFEWDDDKDRQNIKKQGISFQEAQLAFKDPKRVIAQDVQHSSETEVRYYCFGEVEGGILTVRFLYRKHVLRIIGAGYWRKGKKIYEEANNKIYK